MQDIQPFIIQGRVTGADSQQGIHGLLIDIYDKDLLFDDLLGTVLTQQDGHFFLSYDSDAVTKLIDRQPDIYFKVKDRQGNLLYTSEKSCQCSAGQTVEYTIEIQPDKLATHLSEPTTLAPTADKVMPTEMLGFIETALEQLAPAGDAARMQTLRNNLLCPLPPLQEFDDILRDAKAVIEGLPDSTIRFKDAIDNLKTAKAVDRNRLERIDQIQPERLISDPFLDRTQEQLKSALPLGDSSTTMIPTETTVALLSAAVASAEGNALQIHNNVGIVLDQLCGFSQVGPLYRAAEQVLTGDPRGLRSLDKLMRFRGGEWGPDDGPPIPVPDPDPRPEPAPCPRPWPPDPENPKLPINPEEIEAWQCTLEAVRAFRVIGQYRIHTLSNPYACPGETLIIRGENFGNRAGSVSFAGTDGPLTVAPMSWQTDEIRVEVPAKATCGSLSLKIFERTVSVCGRFIDVFRRPAGLTTFKGGKTRISTLVSFHTQGSIPCVGPGRTLGIRWATCNATQGSITIREDDGNVLLQESSIDLNGSLTLLAPNYNRTRELTVTLSVLGRCGNLTRTLRVKVQRPYKLAIDGMEITQGIQYYRAGTHLTDSSDRGSDNSLQMVTGKSAWLRVYLRSGQAATFAGGELPGVTGVLTLQRRQGGSYQTIATLSPQNAPMQAQSGFPSYDAERSTLNSSLNFIVPANLMQGRLRLQVEVSSPQAFCGRASDQDSLEIDVNLQQTLRVAGIMIGYNGPDAAGNPLPLTIPAPNLAALQAEAAWALTTFPISSTAQFRAAATIVTGTPLNDARSAPGACSPNWTPLLNQIQAAITADGNQPGWVYYGLIANGIPVTVPGCNRGTTSGGIQGQPVTFAHEIGHQFGLPHAPCGNAGTTNPNYPAYEPYDPVNMPMASIGEYGLDINTGAIANPNTFEDFMSYCGPRWISIFTHNFLLNNARLNPTMLPSGGAPTLRPMGSRSAEIAGDTQMRSRITLIGRLETEEQVVVESVCRVACYPPAPVGFMSDYVAELVSQQGQVLSAAPVEMLEAEGHGCSGGSCGTEAPYPTAFRAVMPDPAPGATLRIRHGKTLLWEQHCPRHQPAIGTVQANCDDSHQLTLVWDYAVPCEQAPDIWVRWSDNQGDTWHGLSVGLKGNSAQLDVSQLPAREVIFQVVVHDGFYSVMGNSEPVQLAECPPQVSIVHPTAHPTAAAILPTDMPLHLWGAVSCLSRHTLQTDDIVWYLDDTEVGRGLDIWVDNPGLGEYEIRLVVNDPAGAAQATTAITIAEMVR